MANAKEIIEQIAKDTELFNYQVRLVLSSYRKLIINGLVKGESVSFPKFGKFWIRRAQPQIGWNPNEKKKILLSERFIPKFSMGKNSYDFIRKHAKSRDQGNGGKKGS